MFSFRRLVIRYRSRGSGVRYADHMPRPRSDIRIPRAVMITIITIAGALGGAIAGFLVAHLLFG